MESTGVTSTTVQPSTVMTAHTNNIVLTMPQPTIQPQPTIPSIGGIPVTNSSLGFGAFNTTDGDIGPYGHLRISNADTLNMSSPAFIYRSHTMPLTNHQLGMGANPTYGGSSSSGQSSFSSSFNPPTTIRLDRENYLLWRYTVLPIIRGHRLEEHLFSSVPPVGSNPRIGLQFGSYPPGDDWEVKDSLLMGWLLGSMTPPILGDLIGCNTVHEVWRTLEELYNNQSEARMLEYKGAMARAEKGSMPMADYLAMMKNYSDNLAAAGYPISRSELILGVLGGLNRDYEAPIVNITHRVGSMTWQEVQSQLLTHERFLARFNNVPNGVGHVANPVANLAQNNRAAGIGANNGRQGNRGRGNNRGGRGRGRNGRPPVNNNNASSSNGSNRPTCQLCNKIGHTVLECWHRFEEDFVPPNSSNRSGNSGNGPRQVSAYTASPQSASEGAWYLDSGATNHLTSDLNQLHFGSEYTGSETLGVGNGQENRSTSSNRQT